MALDLPLCSADDHVQEPPGLWTGRLSSREWGDRIPRLAPQADGRQRWIMDGRVIDKPLLAPTGGRQEEPRSWEDVPPSTYDPAARLRAMDEDGVEAQVLYPYAAGLSGDGLGAIKDPRLQLACIQAYNDWLLETWAAASPRFVPQCILPITSVEDALTEMERAVARGHRGVVMPPIPWHLNPQAPHLFKPDWDPFWAAASDMGVPICWHAGGWEEMGMMDIYEKATPDALRALDNIRTPQGANIILGNFLFSGVPERFADLKVVFAASGIDWIPFLLEVSDYEWDRICRRGALPYAMDMAPSLAFRRNCRATTWFERAGLSMRQYLGVDTILWQSEFPMEPGTWPHSTGMVERNYRDVPEAERRKILGGNAARLYRLEVAGATGRR